MGGRGRILAAGAFMVLAASGLVARRRCASPPSPTPDPGATVATVILAIASEVLDNIPSLHVVHPVPADARLARVHRSLPDSRCRGPGCAAAIVDQPGVYTAIFLGLALWNFGHKDVTA